MKNKNVYLVFGVIVLIIGIWVLYRLFSPTAYAEMEMDGNSMSEYGLGDGVEARIYVNQTCQVGDFCSFTCISEKCAHEGQLGYEAVKKLTSIKDNCYFFEGNKNEWREENHPGQVAFSHDSNIFGCLTLDEFRMEGVVKK